MLTNFVSRFEGLAKATSTRWNRWENLIGRFRVDGKRTQMYDTD